MTVAEENKIVVGGKAESGSEQEGDNSGPSKVSRANQNVTWELTSHPIFQDEKVLVELAQHLSHNDRLRFREISRSFRKHLTEFLVSRSHARLKFYYSWPLLSYALHPTLLSNNPRNPPRSEFTLSAFSQFYDSSASFPTASFAFKNGNLNSPDLQHFLDKHGKRISQLNIEIFHEPPKEHTIPVAELSKMNVDELEATLVLDTYHVIDPPQVSSLRKLLVEQVPNLRHLDLSKCPHEFWTTHERLFRKTRTWREKLRHVDVDYTLPILKGLVVRQRVPEHIVDDLLLGGVNLEYATFTENNAPCVRAGKFHLLKTLLFATFLKNVQLLESISPTTSSTLSQFVFASDRHHLELTPNLSLRISVVLRNIFEASAATLKNVIWKSPVGFLSNLKIPALPHVERMQIHTNESSRSRVKRTTQFPVGFQFSDSFPRLQSLRLEVKVPSELEWWKDYHCAYAPALTVKSLVFTKCRIPKVWLRHLCQIFPNLESVVVNSSHLDFQDAAVPLWRLSKLKSLSVKFDFVDDYNFFPAVDSAFTGFTNETCAYLYSCGQRVRVPGLDGWRIFPSILQATSLELLRITFVDVAPTLRPCYPQIVTRVTDEYAFRRCPQIKVQVRMELTNWANKKKLKESLKELGAYLICADF